MIHFKPGVQVLSNKLLRLLLSASGLMLFAFGAYLQLRADIGVAPWEALNLGISARLPITYGTACILVSLLVLVTDLAMKEPIGFGTLLDALLVGWGVDLFTRLNLVRRPAAPALQILLLLAGIGIMCLGQVLYIRAGLGCGPRDSLLVALGKRLPKMSIGTVNLLLLTAVFCISLALKNRIGVGTLISTFLTGPMQNLIYRFCKFDPRTPRQESILKTVRDIFMAFI